MVVFAYQAQDAVGIYEGVGALPLKPEEGAQPNQNHLDNIKLIIEEFITADIS